MSAASASIFWSTSQSETTSTGATCMSRNRSHLPYQPQPMRPTRSLAASGGEGSWERGGNRTGGKEIAAVHGGAPGVGVSPSLSRRRKRGNGKTGANLEAMEGPHSDMSFHRTALQ